MTTSTIVLGRRGATRDGGVRTRRTRSDIKIALLFIAPALIGLILFYFVPTIRGLYLSFTEYSVLDDPTWVGTANYERLAQDPRTFGVGVPDMAGLLAAAGCPVVLARGEHDLMVSHDELATLVPTPVTLPGLGHNAHVEDPGAVLALVG